MPLFVSQFPSLFARDELLIEATRMQKRGMPPPLREEEEAVYIYIRVKVGSISPQVLFHFRAALPGGFDIVNASVHSVSPGSFIRVSTSA